MLIYVLNVRYKFSGLLLILGILVLGDALAQDRKFTLPEGINQSDYEHSTIIVKIKKAYANSTLLEKELEQISRITNSKSCKKTFSRSSSNTTSAVQRRIQPTTDLSSIYTIVIPDNTKLEDKISELLALEYIEYAEPYYLPKPLYLPNDPEAQIGGLQTYLEVVKAYEAWEFEKGNSDIVIGILDTGTDLTHEDLIDNIYYNENDTINGIDDDGDGYVDNYHGWDFGNNDNDPSADKSGHGVSVAGVSSATTDNGKGIAGIGFRSKFMPIKIFTSEHNVFYQGYEAMIYAAEQGCDIINLSWGSPGLYSSFVQDIVNYIVNDLDVVIVAAAGNTNADLDFYPASYENVLSVGATSDDDQKASFATYSNFIDVMAPGLDYTTKNGNNYGTSVGSSFSSPLVAGIAALVRSKYPELNAIQVMEKIRLATDDIYDIDGNGAYEEKMGRGRVNALKAVSPTNQPAIRMTNLSYNNVVGPYAVAGDSVMFTMDFINILNATSNAIATLSSDSPYITIKNGAFTIGALSSMEVTNNNDAPFSVFIDPSTPDNEVLTFRIGFDDVNYNDYQYFKVLVNPTHLDLDNGKIKLTISSDGDLAYTNSNLSIGSGFTYEGNKILDHMGLALGTSSTQLVDNIVEDLVSGRKAQDFNEISTLKFYSNSEAEIDVRSQFNDGSALYPINVMVDQKFLGSLDDQHNNFLIVEYRITNVSGSDMSDFFAGIYTDFDLKNYSNNAANWDGVNEIGYIYDALNNEQYAGMALISGQEVLYNALDIGEENGNSADYSDAFEKADKFGLMSTSIWNTAGEIGSGNDVAQFISAKETLLKNNESAKIAFVIAIDKNTTDLINTVNKAKTLYQTYIENPPISETIQICLGENTTVNPMDGVQYRFYKNADTSQFITQGESITTSTILKDTSFYVVNADLPYLGDIEQIKISIDEPNVAFSTDRDIVYIDESNNSTVNYTDLSNSAVEWNWDFGNGYLSSNQHPAIDYTTEGTFTTQLEIKSIAGCIENTSSTITVLRRSPMPEIAPTTICKGESVTIAASNTTELKFYGDAELTNLLLAASQLEITDIQKDTTLFIINEDSPVESLPLELLVDVDEISGKFDDQMIVESSLEDNVILFTADDFSANSYSWFINDQLVGNGETHQYTVNQEENLLVSLVTSTELQCKDSSNILLEVVKSAPPTESNFRFCLGTNVSLNFSDDILHNYYKDPEMTEFIAKGYTIDVGQLAESSTIYYTNLSTYLESDVAAINIDIVDNFAEMGVEEEIMLYSKGTTSIIDLSEHSTNRNWFIDQEYFSSDANFEYEFTESGNYKIKLVSTNDIGCVDSIEQNVRVLLVTGIQNPYEDSAFNIYPNPVKDKLYLNHNYAFTGSNSIQIYDSNGKKVNSYNVTQEDLLKGLNLSFIKPGIYYLKFLTETNQLFTEKLIIEE